MERLPLLTIYCGKYSLKTGSLVVGVLSLVFSCLTVVAMMILSSSIHSQIEDAQIDMVQLDVMKRSFVMFMVTAVFGFIHLIFDIILIFGTLKHQPTAIWIWLIYNIGCIVVGILISIVGAAFNIIDADYWALIITIFMSVMNTVVTVLNIIIVNSHYIILKSKLSRHTLTIQSFD